MTKTVLITGAAGNLGSKLRYHWQEQYALRLIDLNPKGDQQIVSADLSVWQDDWANQFQGVDTVIHLAADPRASRSWAELTAPNIDAVINVFAAATRSGVKRVIYASSNHAMGGYKEIATPHTIDQDTPPLPGTFYDHRDGPQNSIPYGSAKYMGERIGKCYADIYGLSTIVVRIGWIRAGENNPADAQDVPDWFKLMWISNRDFCHLITCCVEADPAIKFAIVNGMSANTGMRWDVDAARQLVGYQPQDDVILAAGN